MDKGFGLQTASGKNKWRGFIVYQDVIQSNPWKVTFSLNYSYAFNSKDEIRIFFSVEVMD